MVSHGWDEATERETLRAWLDTVPEAERTPWAVYCLGAARRKLLADETIRAQQREIVELQERLTHLERKFAWLEPDASRWLADLTRARARVQQLESELTQHGLPLPPPPLAEEPQASSNRPSPAARPLQRGSGNPRHVSP